MNKKKTKIMLNIDSGILREIRALATESGVSVSEFLSRQIAEIGGRRLAYRHAKKRALARLREGMDLGWTPPASRSELHER